MMKISLREVKKLDQDHIARQPGSHRAGTKAQEPGFAMLRRVSAFAALSPFEEWRPLFLSFQQQKGGSAGAGELSGELTSPSGLTLDLT